MEAEKRLLKVCSVKDESANKKKKPANKKKKLYWSVWIIEILADWQNKKCSFYNSDLMNIFSIRVLQPSEV